MLPPLGAPLPQDLQDRGRHLLDTLQGLPLDQQLDLGCRTVLAVLLASQSPTVNGMWRPEGR